MFKTIDQRLAPKQYNHQESGEARDELEYIKPPTFEEEVEGEEIKPNLFPEELWDLVHPKQRRRVKWRFDKFTDEEYLKLCVEKILNQLDILNRGEELVDWGKGKIKQQDSKIMKGHALANIDTYFFSNPRVAELARDVVAEIITADERPMRCRPRKLSAVQQAFLQAKTKIMVRQGKLEDSHGQWSHGLVLVAYEERIKKFMDEHRDQAMDNMFNVEYEDEVATFFRLYIDLRMLNSKTIPDNIYPLPRIDDLVELIPRNCGRFSISDICDAFVTCELKKEHRPKTAFKTHDRHLQFAVLPQGSSTHPVYSVDALRGGNSQHTSMMS